jgi:hypothetical protein
VKTAQANAVPTSSLITVHTCAHVDIPRCTGTLKANYDSYKCLASYTCTPAQTTATTNTETAGASCVGPDGKGYADGQTATYSDWCDPRSSMMFCGSGSRTCHNGQWFSATQASSNACVYLGETYAPGATSEIPGPWCAGCAVTLIFHVHLHKRSLGEFCERPVLSTAGEMSSREEVAGRSRT